VGVSGYPAGDKALGFRIERLRRNLIEAIVESIDELGFFWSHKSQLSLIPAVFQVPLCDNFLKKEGSTLVS
jgi:hypothetical protein